jgi:hypothetical protein
MDSLLRDHTPGPTVPVHPAILEARATLREGTPLLLAIPDGSALERRWRWRADERGRAEVRYAFYRCAEALDRAGVEIELALAAAGISRAASAPILGLATVARWELHGALAPLTDADLDRDPGNDEWTLRQTLAHIVNVQRAYASFTAWWLARRAEPDFPAAVPDGVGGDFPDEASEGIGSVEEIRARLDDAMDVAAGRLGALDAGELAANARWSGYAVDVGFRLGRWGSHLREHTIQVDKTLVMLDRPTREVERLVRHVHAAFGRMESTVFALPPEAVEPAASIIGGAAREIGEVVRSVASTRR